MAATYQNLPHSIGYPTGHRDRARKPNLQHPSTTTLHPDNIKIKFGNNSQPHKTNQPPSILKKKTYPNSSVTNPAHSNAFNWHQPSDLEPMSRRRIYTPLRTPPRLRTLITPPGIEPYRNRHNLRRLTSPLPTISDIGSAPAGLNVWGVTPNDLHLHSNINLIRPYPSPLSHYGLGSDIKRQKKPYIVVPHLSNILSPPVSNGVEHSDILLSRRTSPVLYRSARSPYVHRLFLSPPYYRDPSDYVFKRPNVAVSNSYVNDLIGSSIHDELLPDLLLEVINELDHQNKINDASYKRRLDDYYADLNRRLRENRVHHDGLLSDELIRDYDGKHRSIHQPNAGLHPAPPQRINQHHRYHELPLDTQGRLLANINQELIDLEIENLLRELSNQELRDRLHHPLPPHNRNFETHDTPFDDQYDMDDETPRHSIHPQPIDDDIDQSQRDEIQDYAQAKMVDTVCLDQLIHRCIKQRGSAVDHDDNSRLLDGVMLNNLIDHHHDEDETEPRTMDNYASKKFHLNTFMNVTMDLLLNELSSSLIEDMKDLDDQERKTY